MRHLWTVTLVLAPLLLFGAWLLAESLVDRPSPDLGAPVVVTNLEVTTTTSSDRSTSSTSSTTLAPPERTSVPTLPEVPEVPEVTQGAESPTLYPTCPAGTDDGNDDDNDGVAEVDDDDGVTDVDDERGDRLDDLCDE